VTRQRTAFEEVPELYDRVRPAYPAPVFDDLMALAGLSAGSRVVEIGCGTGKATLPLAARGLRVTGVELGERLAAVARRNLAAFPAVEVVAAEFESWRPRAADFDAVVAFTAFHWIDPERRYAKAAALLREGGALGVVGVHHVLPEGGDRFFVDVEADYRAILPDGEPWCPPRPDEVVGFRGEIEASGFFGSLVERRHLWEVTYKADDFVALLDTYSDHRALEEATRRSLFDRIRRRIEGRPDGRVRKTYVATLDVAKRL
jgi:SAM-dependent methyltransferase